MTLVAITQRVVVDARTGERRDALDARWGEFFAALGLSPLILPNHPGLAMELVLDLDPAGAILSGGGDLTAYGGDAEARDATEAALIDWATQKDRPLVGVCRGMQQMLHREGARLQRGVGHVGARHLLNYRGARVAVNSYHDWIVPAVPERDFEVLARAEDGMVEAVRHRRLNQVGIMWHPEREAPFAAHDLALFREMFGGKPAEAGCAA